MLEVPIVALEPTVHHTLADTAPFLSTIVEYESKITVVAAWKIHCDEETFFPSSMRKVLDARESVPGDEQYTPEKRVPDRIAVGSRVVQVARRPAEYAVSIAWVHA